MRTPEQNANRQVNFAAQFVEAIDKAEPDEAKVLDVLTWLNDAGLRLAPAKDERVGLAVLWLTQSTPKPSEPSVSALEAVRRFMDIIISAGEAFFPGGGSVIVDVLKAPCDDPDCEKCRVFADLVNEVEIEAVTDAVSHGHTLDEDCPVCKHDDAQ